MTRTFLTGSMLFLILAWSAWGAAQAPLGNGGFEAGESAEALQAWRCDKSHEWQGDFVLDAATKAEGTRSLRISGTSEQQPHRYGRVYQRIAPLHADVPYRVHVKAKGEGVGKAWFGGGPDWRVRHSFSPGDFDWQSFEMTITAPEGSNGFDFLIIVESPTQALWIDDVRVEAAVDLDKPIIRAVSPDKASVVPVFKQTGLVCDGVLDEWPDAITPLKDDAGRVDARFRLAWDDDALWLAVEADDEPPYEADTPEWLWLADSVQVSIDPRNEDTQGSYGPNDYELGWGFVDGEATAHGWKLPDGVEPEAVARSKAAIAHANGVTTCEIAIPWSLFPMIKDVPGHALGLNVVVNDRDAEAERTGAQWTKGTFFSKFPAYYKTLVMTTGPWMTVEARPATIPRDGFTRLQGSICLGSPVTANLSIGSYYEGEAAFDAGLSEFVYFIRGATLNEGENTIPVSAKGGGVDFAGECTVELSLAKEQALAQLEKQEARLPQLKDALEKARGDGLPVHYPQADLTIAELFCQYCRDDIAHERFDRAVQVATEVETLLNRAGAEMREGVEVPVVQVGTTEIRDGSLWGQCRVGGAMESRPVFLTGYGHFSPVVEALPTLEKIGINIIQFEMGPNSVVFENGVNPEAIRSRVIPALDRARDYNVSVCFLTSPHYFPQWALEKWPSLRVQNGFFKNSFDAPQARTIYEDYLRALIPLVKDHPALQSICLSNEPISPSSHEDPYRIPMWQEYLQREYETIARLNNVYGSAYRDFESIPHPPLNVQSPRGPLYDAVQFNQEAFSEFHAWMAGMIRDMAPDLPCHAKVMALPTRGDTVFWGTDPWQFAELSQLNGNDCYFLPNFSSGPWASNWIVQNMYYDLQRSMKQVPIFNTENHIISDREQRYVLADHIYAAIWQGAIHGQGGSMTWAWQRTYDATSDFEGLILHRPECTAAMSRCALDLMRLSYEVAALQNQTPQVALLYSHAATLASSRHVSARQHVYEALNFCGIPIGFITDEQIAAGWLDRYQCLIVPQATAVAGDAIEGIRQFKQGGGMVIAYGNKNLEENGYGLPAAPVAFTVEIPETPELQTLRDRLTAILVEAAVGPALALASPAGGVPFGVEWRTAELENRTVVNLICLSKEPVTVILPGSNWRDRISGDALQSEITLTPNRPVLASRGQ